MFKIGCCGFPKGLKKYCESFDVVEVQSTFYSMPSEETARRWHEEVGKDFEFTVKAWQLITHPATSPTYKKLKTKINHSRMSNYGFFKQTEEVWSAWRQTKTICEILHAKIVLFQTPSSFRPTFENIANLREFLKKIDTELRIVFEPRGPEWTDEIVESICKNRNVIHCTDPFARLPVGGGRFAYFRLHGTPPGKKMYAYKYTDDDLKKLHNICKKFENGYCFFNNLYMYEDALRFKKMML